jgi:hypothetical protein
VIDWTSTKLLSGASKARCKPPTTQASHQPKAIINIERKEMKPTDVQRAVLEAAAKHPQKQVIEFPANINGGARNKVIKALHKAQWVTPSEVDPDAYVITPAGMEAAGIKLSMSRSHREGTKQALLLNLLKQPGGVSLHEMAQATGWQHHTVRGAMAGALKKKMGLNIVSEKSEGQDRKYRIA